MSREMGKFKQGDVRPHAPAEPRTSGVPERAKPAGAVPRGRESGFETHQTAPNNDGKKAH